MHKKFEINQTKIKGGYQSRRKNVTYISKSDLTLKANGKMDHNSRARFSRVIDILGLNSILSGCFRNQNV